MKKMFITLLFAATFFNVKAQSKSGILQKDYYGKFTANQWEGFLAGNDAKAFEEKATVKLKTYLVDVNDFVKKQLNEKDIAGAMDNSIKKAFPADADVYTSRADGSWITRKTYPGEEGFYHVPTGTYWLSFECGNLCNFKVKAVDPGSLTGNNRNPGSGNANPNGINITVNGQQGGQELSWSAGYTVYSQGRNDRTNDILADFTVFKMAQDAKECCGGGQQQLVASNAIPVAGASNVSMMQVPTGFQQAKPRFVETFFGQVAVNTIGTAGGILLVRGLDNLMYRLMYRGGNYYYAPSGDGYNPGTGGPVQGGFSSTGFITGGGTVLSYNGATPVQGAGFQWGN